MIAQLQAVPRLLTTVFDRVGERSAYAEEQPRDAKWDFRASGQKINR
jgi:hypothetical protein